MFQLDERVIEQMKKESKELKNIAKKDPALMKRFNKELKRLEQKAIDIGHRYGESLNDLTSEMRDAGYKIALRKEGFGKTRFERISHRVAMFASRCVREFDKTKDKEKAKKFIQQELEKHMYHEKEFDKSANKTYLSNEERSDLASFLAIGNNIQYFIENNKGISSKERLLLENATVNLTKFYEVLATRLGEVVFKQIDKDVKEKELALVTKAEYREMSKRYKPELTWGFDSIDQRDDFLEGVIKTYCTGCKKKPIKDCGIRKWFMKHGVEAMNYYAEDGECQYKYPDIIRHEKTEQVENNEEIDKEVINRVMPLAIKSTLKAERTKRKRKK